MEASCSYPRAPNISTLIIRTLSIYSLGLSSLRGIIPTCVKYTPSRDQELQKVHSCAQKLIPFW